MIGRPSKPPLIDPGHDEDGDDETSQAFNNVIKENIILIV